MIDDELEDAQWFTREQVAKGIATAAWEPLRQPAVAAKAVDAASTASDPPASAAASTSEPKPPLVIRLPPPFAIAHQLAQAWVQTSDIAQLGLKSAAAESSKL